MVSDDDALHGIIDKLANEIGNMDMSTLQEALKDYDQKDRILYAAECQRYLNMLDLYEVCFVFFDIHVRYLNIGSGTCLTWPIDQWPQDGEECPEYLPATYIRLQNKDNIDDQRYVLHIQAMQILCFADQVEWMPDTRPFMDEWMPGRQFDGVSIGRILWKGAFATMNMFWLKEESPLLYQLHQTASPES